MTKSALVDIVSLLVDLIDCFEYTLTGVLMQVVYNRLHYSKGKSCCRHVWRRGFFGGCGSAETAGL